MILGEGDWGFRNAECGMRNLECGMRRSAGFALRAAESGLSRSARLRIWDCGLTRTADLALLGLGFFWGNSVAVVGEWNPGLNWSGVCASFRDGECL